MKNTKDDTTFPHATITPTAWTILSSPLGDLFLAGSEEYITHLDFSGVKRPPTEGLSQQMTPALIAGREQLAQYFAGQRHRFSLSLAPAGTEFQKKVWQALMEIPYGETCSYGDIARQVGRPKAFRAVGGANNRNPISIIIPCHRVIGADGTLVGYGSGLSNKTWLLHHEEEHKSTTNAAFCND